MIASLEIAVLVLSVAGLIVLSRLSAAGHLGPWADNEIAVGGLVSLLVSGIGFGFVGLWFAADSFGGSVAADIAIMLGGFVAVVVALAIFTRGSARRLGA